MDDDAVVLIHLPHVLSQECAEGKKGKKGKREGGVPTSVEHWLIHCLWMVPYLFWRV